MARTYKEWNGWVLEEDGGPTTVTLSYPPAADYWIPVGQLRTSAQVLDWVVQISQKNWATDACLGGLVLALDAILNLQANFCGSGIEQGGVGACHVCTKQILSAVSICEGCLTTPPPGTAG